MPRQEALRYMRLDIFNTADSARVAAADNEPGEMLSSGHLELLQKICDETSLDAQVFWAMAHLCKRLADWGNKVSGFLHGCLCHDRQKEKETRATERSSKSKKGSAGAESEYQLASTSAASVSDAAETGGGICAKDCPMKGRMAVALAAGFAQQAAEHLQTLKNLSHRQQSALRNLRRSGQDGEAAANRLLSCYHAAIGRLSFRMGQSFGYWTQLPWALLMIAKPFVAKFESAEEAASTDTLNLVLNPIKPNPQNTCSREM